MKYLLSAVLLCCSLPAMAQTPGVPAGKDIRSQTPAELVKTAADLQQALVLQPNNVDLHVKLGFTYARLHRIDDAQRAFEDAVRLDPRKAIAQYMLGLIYEKKGMKAQAVAAWQACLDNAPDAHMRETALKHLNNLKQ
jgi:cytochrome c-type biogenesis protein CcmH/NrfG